MQKKTKPSPKAKKGIKQLNKQQMAKTKGGLILGSQSSGSGAGKVTFNP